MKVDADDISVSLLQNCSCMGNIVNVQFSLESYSSASKCFIQKLLCAVSKMILRMEALFLTELTSQALLPGLGQLTIRSDFCFQI